MNVMNLFFKNLKMIFIGISMLIIPACTSSPEPLDPGRCRLTTDCAPGNECVDTRCEDLYYPRHKIKPY